MEHPKFWVLLTFFILPFICCDFGKNADNLYEEGMKELKQGKVESAYKFFKRASKKDIKNHKYSWAAASTAPNQNESFVQTKASWDNGLKTPLVLMKLTSVAFHTSLEQKLNYALNLYKELPDSLRTNEFKGDIFFNFEKYDSALAIWNSIKSKKPSAEIVNKIALCYQKSGKTDTLMIFLESSRKQKLLNSTGYLMLSNLWLKDYDYAMVDSVFRMAERDGAVDDAYKAEYASVLMFSNRINDAQKMLREVSRTGSLSASLKLYSSTLLSYSYFLTRDSLSLKTAMQNNDTTDFIKTTVKKLSGILLSLRADTALHVKEIRSLHKKAPYDPVVQLVLAQELKKAKNFEAADSAYRKLPATLFFSPAIVVDIADLKAKIGKDDEAMVLINRLHENKVYNKKSLELFRDLAFKKKLFEKSDAAQKILQKKFKDDVTVQWSGALLALGKGKIDSAITIFTELAKNHPSEEIFEMMRINAYLLKGDLKSVLSACSTTWLPQAAKNIFKARAYRKMGDAKNAKVSYEIALKTSKTDNVDVYLEYAEYLLETDDQNRASSIFADLINKYEKSSKKNDAYFSSILNNFAWTAMNSQNMDKNTVLNAAKKAIELQPSNHNILDTYATALLKYDNYKECIKLLKDDKSIVSEARLLVHLAQAYEKSGDVNKAVRLYKDALALPDSVQKLSPKINKVKINNHMKDLLFMQK